MTARVCLLANTLYYPEAGGHMWPYLHWALGLRALDVDVVWLESIGDPKVPANILEPYVAALRARLDRHGLADTLALCSWTGEKGSAVVTDRCLDLNAAAETDLLLSLAYDKVSPGVIARFRRSALVDIDPGLTQTWIAEGQMAVGGYDTHFTIGEWVRQSEPRVPDCGLRWHYTPPPVCLTEWNVAPADGAAVFTTVTHWGGEGIDSQGRSLCNSKRDGFLPFLELPTRTTQTLELAVFLKGYDQSEPAIWQTRGWRMCNAHEVAGTPGDYRKYVERSRGEFSCAKPAYVQMESGWTSDRTLCYLASGKPAIVQHTGPSAFLPDAGGIFRFRTLDEAVRCLEMAASDYEHHCRLARKLAEEFFDAKKVVRSVLERAL